jgi:hypothetical protein
MINYACMKQFDKTNAYQYKVQKGSENFLRKEPAKQQAI